MIDFIGCHPCSDLVTRAIKWIPAQDQIKNGSRSSAYINWGVSTESLLAQLASLFQSHTA